MKNIFKSILTVALFAGLSSCEEESNLAYIQPAANASFQIITPTSGEGAILSATALNNPAISTCGLDLYFDENRVSFRNLDKGDYPSEA